MDKLKRYIIFLIGLFINSLGVSLITKAALGTSPISSIPYVLSLIFPFTLGQFTIYFSVLLVVLQLLILRRKFKIEHLLQIPISIAFGYFIDLTMEMYLLSIRNCVIVGRAADYVLREDPNCLKIFLHADANAKIQRIKEREQLSEKEAEKKIAHEEKLRAANYHYYTHRMWGHAGNYDLTLDTAIGIDHIEQIVRIMLSNE